jgi:hypothetical protein
MYSGPVPLLKSRGKPLIHEGPGFHGHEKCSPAFFHVKKDSVRVPPIAPLLRISLRIERLFQNFHTSHGSLWARLLWTCKTFPLDFSMSKKILAGCPL